MADEPKQEKKANVKALKDFFGTRPGEGIKEFSDELKKLSHEEKLQLSEGIENGTLNY
jgi:hypothetical protein